MPTYVYRREDGSTFEIEQRITADPLETCPETGQKVERVISGSAGLIFKGSGFYLTDYVRGNRNGSSKASESTDSTNSENGSTSKSRSEATSESKGSSESTTSESSASAKE